MPATATSYSFAVTATSTCGKVLAFDLREDTFGDVLGHAADETGVDGPFTFALTTDAYVEVCAFDTAASLDALYAAVDHFASRRSDLDLATYFEWVEETNSPVGYDSACRASDDYLGHYSSLEAFAEEYISAVQECDAELLPYLDVHQMAQDYIDENGIVVISEGRGFHAFRE